MQVLNDFLLKVLKEGLLNIYTCPECGKKKGYFKKEIKISLFKGLHIDRDPSSKKKTASSQIVPECKYCDEKMILE